MATILAVVEGSGEGAGEKCETRRVNGHDVKDRKKRECVWSGDRGKEVNDIKILVFIAREGPFTSKVARLSPLCQQSDLVFSQLGKETGNRHAK